MNFHVLAEEEIVIGFGFVGVPGTPISTPEEAREAFGRLTADRSAQVLILTEQVSAMIHDEVNSWQAAGSYPLVVEIPGLHGRVPGKMLLVDAIRQAVGIHV